MSDTTKMVLLYGESGIGKTTLALTAPQPHLVLDQEGSRSILEGYTEWIPNETPVKELAEGNHWVAAANIVPAVRAEAQHPGKFASVIFDSVTNWQRTLARHSTTGNRYGQAGDVYKYWSKIYEDTMGLLDMLHTMKVRAKGSCHVICTAQLYRRQDEHGTATLLAPSLYGQGRDEFIQASDLVGYLTLDTQGNRYMATAKTPVITAKHRSKLLAESPNPFPIKAETPVLTNIIEGW